MNRQIHPLFQILYDFRRSAREDKFDKFRSISSSSVINNLIAISLTIRCRHVGMAQQHTHTHTAGC